MTSFFRQNDVVNNGFKNFTDLAKRHPHLQSMLAIGGWAEGGKKYSQMAGDPAKRNSLIGSIVGEIFLCLFGYSKLR